MTLVKVPVPWRGLNLASEPDALAAGQGAMLQNVLPGRADQLVARGPANPTGYTLPVSNKDGVFDGGGGAWISPDNNGSGILMMAGVTATVTRNGGAPFALAPGVTQITPSHARMNGYTVGCTSAGGFLMTWDGNTTLKQLSNGPQNASSVASHLTRLFALVQVGFDYELRWTDPNPNLPTDTLALWQDDASGLTNKIVLPSGDWYRDLAVYNRTLYIISAQNVYALTGDTPATFGIRRVLETGSGQRSGYGSNGGSTSTTRGLYFWSSDGVMRWDGATSEVISQPVAPLVDSKSYHQLQAVGNGFVSLVTEGSWLVYHEASAAWASMSSPLLPASTLHNGAAGLPTCVRRRGDNWTAISAGRYSSNTPGAALDVAQCFAPDGAASGATAYGSPAAAGASAFIDGFTTPYPVSALSGSIRVSSPDKKAALQRLFAQAANGGWTVQLEDEDGNAIGGPAVIAPTTFKAGRSRAETSTPSEVDVVRVRFTWSGSITKNSAPSVGDAYVLTDAAQQR